MVNELFEIVTNKIDLVVDKFNAFLYEEFGIGHIEHRIYWPLLILLYLYYFFNRIRDEYHKIDNVNKYSKIKLFRLVLKNTIKSMFVNGKSEGSDFLGLFGFLLMIFFVSVVIFNGLRKNW